MLSCVPRSIVCRFFNAYYVGMFGSFLVADIVTTFTRLFTTFLSPVQYVCCSFQARSYSTLFPSCLLQLLMEEASKLESAESFSLKKTRDKNSLLDTEMTDWMLNSVQKAQIGKTDMCATVL
jgi:hypothetical protein